MIIIVVPIYTPHEQHSNELDQELFGYVEERNHGNIHVLELHWDSRLVSPTTTVTTTTRQHNTARKSATRVLSRVSSCGRAFSNAQEIDYGVDSK